MQQNDSLPDGYCRLGGCEAPAELIVHCVCRPQPQEEVREGGGAGDHSSSGGSGGREEGVGAEEGRGRDQKFS